MCSVLSHIRKLRITEVMYVNIQEMYGFFLKNLRHGRTIAQRLNKSYRDSKIFKFLR